MTAVDEFVPVRALGVVEKMFATYAEFNAGNYVHSLHFTSTVEITDDHIIKTLKHLIQ